MRKLLWVTAVGFVTISSAAHAATQEERLYELGQIPLYALIALVIIFALAVYFMRFQDKRLTPLRGLFQQGDAIHSVGPDSSVTDGVRLMASKKIGAVLIMDGGRLLGIFTERDALNKVLAAGLDPAKTKISVVMTKDPYCASSTTTVREAMAIVTKHRFRHLPIVDNGRVLAVVSSGDLTHWLVQDRLGEVQELVELAGRSA